MGYMLFVNDNPTGGVVNSLEEAKQSAAPKIEPSLRIEWRDAPAPNRIWIYDRQEKIWVEQK